MQKSLNSITLLVFAGMVAFSNAGQGAEVDAKQIHDIFVRSCAECHGTEVARPKAGFGFVNDLTRLAADPSMIVPGEPDQSEIYRVLVEEDEDLKMPPPKSDIAALSESEISAVRNWILAGAPPPAMEAAAVASGTPASAPIVLPERGVMTPKVYFAHMHPILVHFPIALLMAAALVEFVGIWRRRFFAEPVRWMLVLGVLGGCASLATGWVNAEVEGFANATVFAHRWLAVSTNGLALLALLTAAIALRTGNRGLQTIARLLLFAAALLVGVTGHTGGILVYGEDYLPLPF